MSYDHATVFVWDFSHPGNFSFASTEIRDSNIFSYCSIIVSFGLHSRCVHGQEMMWSSISTIFINFFHMGAIFCFFPDIFNVIHTYWQKWSVFDERTYIPNPVFSPIQVLMKLLRIVSPMTTANGWPCKFRSRGNMGSSMLSHDFGLLCRGRRIQTCGHSFFRIFLSNLRASSNCTWEKSDIASALCPSQPGNLAITSIIFAAVGWDADEPCSVNIASAPESSFLFVSLWFQNSSLLLILPISHAGLVSSLFHSLSTAAFASDIFSACGTAKLY